MQDAGDDDLVRPHVEPGLGAHRGRVGARAGLGERVGGEPLAAREPRQPALLLLVRAGEPDGERAELLHGDDQAARGADLRDLLDRYEAEQRASAEPAVLLFEEDAEELVLAEELDDVPRELGGLVDLGCAGRDPFPCQRPHEVADLALLVRQREGDARSDPVHDRRHAVRSPFRLTSQSNSS